MTESPTIDLFGGLTEEQAEELRETVRLQAVEAISALIDHEEPRERVEAAVNLAFPIAEKASTDAVAHMMDQCGDDLALSLIGSLALIAHLHYLTKIKPQTVLGAKLALGAMRAMAEEQADG